MTLQQPETRDAPGPGVPAGGEGGAELEGRFAGCKLNVPVPDVSCVDLVTTLKTPAGPKEVNEIFRSAAGSVLKGILDTTDEPIVSSDVADSEASCTFDALATMDVGETMVKTLGWYAQGGGLAHRLVDVLRQLAPGAER